MIRYQLKCTCHNEFEAWFASSADFDMQQEKGFVTCPACGSSEVAKALMAPRVSTARKKEAREQKKTANIASGMAQEVMQQMKSIREHIHVNTDDVGEKFSDEARKMHYGDAQERGIRGTASPDQITELVEEGVEIAPIPALPDEAN